MFSMFLYLRTFSHFVGRSFQCSYSCFTANFLKLPAQKLSRVYFKLIWYNNFPAINLKSTISTTACHFLNLPVQRLYLYFLNLLFKRLSCHFLNLPFKQHSRHKFNYPRFFMAVSHYKYNAGTQAIRALLTSGNYFPATLLYTVYNKAFKHSFCIVLSFLKEGV